MRLLRRRLLAMTDGRDAGEGREGHGQNAFVCAVLVVVTLSVFLPVVRCGFVNLDDPTYVTNNAFVKAGLTVRGVVAALTGVGIGHWHPLTWLSHMLDVQLFGLNPGAHHAVNLAFHLVNTLLVFAFFQKTTGARGRSAFAAALFAIHPLHVEPVAWVASRKDVLSTLFLLLTMHAHARFVGNRARVWQALVAVAFLFGLMSKPMLVSVPILLLLLDYWPLGRFEIQGQTPNSPAGNGLFSRVVSMNSVSVPEFLREKFVLFAMSVASCGMTYFAARSGGAVGSWTYFPVWVRAANAATSYLMYVVKTVWPSHLAAFYPHPGRDISLAFAGLALLVVAGVSAVVFALRRRSPYLLAGWLWYLAALLPVIGLVQIGSHAMADRYTYVPLIGLFVMAAWGIPELLSAWHPQAESSELAGVRRRREMLRLGAVACAIALALISAVQVRYWRSTATLLEHALRVTSNNSLAHDNLGEALAREGDMAGALAHFNEALRIDPNYETAHYNVGVAMLMQGRLDEAKQHLAAAVAIKPTYANAHYNLGVVLLAQNDFAGAIEQFQETLRLEPQNEEVRQYIEKLSELPDLQPLRDTSPGP